MQPRFFASASACPSAWVAAAAAAVVGCSDPAAPPAPHDASLFAGADTGITADAGIGAKPAPDGVSADAAEGTSRADAPVDAPPAGPEDAPPANDGAGSAPSEGLLHADALPLDADAPGTDDTAATADATAATDVPAPADTPMTQDTAPAVEASGADSPVADAPAADATNVDATGVDAPALPPDGSGAPDTGNATDTAPPPAVPTVRFAALGDAGKGNDTQYKVGAALGQKCKAAGCDFVLLLGDNFYSTGTKDENDPQFKSKFEDPYQDVAAPFFVVLGNHDYGGEGAGYELWKGDNYKKYAKKNPKFVHPDNAYDKVVGHAHLFALDSNLMMYGLGGAQVAKFGPLIKNATETWKIAFAHHPYLSNGKHGNAGQYEGLPFIPIVSGDGVKKDYEAILCGKVDLLISGHDHSRQWVKASAKCQGVEFFVAGAGASTTEIKSKSLLFTPSPVWFEDASVGGFLWIELKGKHLKGEFWDENGKLSYTREYDKP